MRRAFGVVLLGALVPLFAAAAQPPKEKDKDTALLKPVTPPAGQNRVRILLSEGSNKAIQCKAQVPTPKGKKGDATDAMIALDTAGRSIVTGKMIEKWGFPMPAGKTFILPELLVVANQLVPKTT